MPDSMVSKLANLLVEYSVAVKPIDEVAIYGSYEAMPLIKEVFREVVEHGGYPVIVNIYDEVFEEIFYRLARDELLSYVSSIEKEIASKITARINILSSTHTKHLVGIDPERIKRRSASRAPLMEIFMERSAKGELKWVVAPYPTRALAQEAGMSIIEYEEFVYKATLVDRDNPVSAWLEKAREQQKIADFLNKVSELRYEGPGISLALGVSGRTWINDDGRHNMPGGEVFTAPIEDSAEGFVEFDYPAIWRGVEVDGVRLVFSKGVVVEARAVRGEEFLRKMISVDEGASRLGEIAFGLNYSIDRFTKEILFDEKIGGTIHMALGAAYPESGGRNKSAIHWDMIKDMRRGRVYADGELVYENGKFLLEVI